jgi:hypothetical protein
VLNVACEAVVGSAFVGACDAVVGACDAVVGSDL